MKNVVETSCEYCGKVIVDYEYRQRKFCDWECSNKSRTSIESRKITKEALREYYVEQRMTSRKIAEMYNTNKTYILRQLKKHNIDRRTVAVARHHDEYQQPTKEELLELYVDKWMSYEAIAEIYKVDKTTIPYWLKRHGINRRKNSETFLGKDFYEPTKDELESLYCEQLLSTSDIATVYNCSSGTISKRLKENGIELRPNLFNGAEFLTCKDGHVVRSRYELAFDNTLNEFGIQHEYEPRIPIDKRYASDFLVGDIYIEIWGVQNNAKYNERKDKKIRMYQENGLKLFQVYPKDFKNLYGKINELKRLIS